MHFSSCPSSEGWGPTWSMSSAAKWCTEWHWQAKEMSKSSFQLSSTKGKAAKLQNSKDAGEQEIQPGKMTTCEWNSWALHWGLPQTYFASKFTLCFFPAVFRSLWQVFLITFRRISIIRETRGCDITKITPVMANVYIYRWEKLTILGLLKISRASPHAYPQIIRMLDALPPSSIGASALLLTKASG